MILAFLPTTQLLALKYLITCLLKKNGYYVTLKKYKVGLIHGYLISLVVCWLMVAFQHLKN